MVRLFARLPTAVQVAAAARGRRRPDTRNITPFDPKIETEKRKSASNAQNYETQHLSYGIMQICVYRESTSVDEQFYRIARSFEALNVFRSRLIPENIFLTAQKQAHLRQRAAALIFSHGARVQSAGLPGLQVDAYRTRYLAYASGARVTELQCEEKAFKSQTRPVGRRRSSCEHDNEHLVERLINENSLTASGVATQQARRLDPGAPAQTWRRAVTVPSRTGRPGASWPC